MITNEYKPTHSILVLSTLFSPLPPCLSFFTTVWFPPPPGSLILSDEERYNMRLGHYLEAEKKNENASFKESFFKVKGIFCTGELMEKTRIERTESTLWVRSENSASLQCKSCESTDFHFGLYHVRCLIKGGET